MTIIISYQCAGMEKPEYGRFIRDADLPGHMFVLFDGDERGRFVHRDCCKTGRHASWWHQDDDGKWHCEEEAT